MSTGVVRLEIPLDEIVINVGVHKDRVCFALEERFNNKPRPVGELTLDLVARLRDYYGMPLDNAKKLVEEDASKARASLLMALQNRLIPAVLRAAVNEAVLRQIKRKLVVGEPAGGRFAFPGQVYAIMQLIEPVVLSKKD